MVGKILNENADVAPAGDNLFDVFHDRRRVGMQHGIRKIKQKIRIHAAENGQNILLSDKFLLRAVCIAAEAQTLVGNAQTVTHSAVRRTRNAHQRFIFDFSPCGTKYAPCVRRKIMNRKAAKIKTLAAGKYRCGESLRFGRCKNENNMCGRLFESFQKSVVCTF